jgi:hypothetical protein
VDRLPTHGTIEARVWCSKAAAPSPKHLASPAAKTSWEYGNAVGQCKCRSTWMTPCGQWKSKLLWISFSRIREMLVLCSSVASHHAGLQATYGVHGQGGRLLTTRNRGDIIVTIMQVLSPFIRGHVVQPPPAAERGYSFQKRNFAGRLQCVLDSSTCLASWRSRCKSHAPTKAWAALNSWDG